MKATKLSGKHVLYIFELHRLAEVKAGTLAGNLSELAQGVQSMQHRKLKVHFLFGSSQKAIDQRTSVQSNWSVSESKSTISMWMIVNKKKGIRKMNLVDIADLFYFNFEFFNCRFQYFINII